MSDNAETREALRRALERHFGSFLAHDPHNPEVFWERGVDAVLAALPPVAGPEVRPDETLRAKGVWRCQACGTTADEPCRSNGCPDNGDEALTGERQMLAEALRDCMADLAVAQDDAAATRRFLTDERAAVADMEKRLADLRAEAEEAKAQCRRLNRRLDDSEAKSAALAAPAPAPGDEGLRARIEALHHEDGSAGVCSEDGFSWPCSTIAALASPAQAATEVGEGAL